MACVKSVFCAAMGVADMHVRYVNRHVLGNIEATNATRSHIDTYIHTNIPRDVGRCHDQCGACSGSPQLCIASVSQLGSLTGDFHSPLQGSSKKELSRYEKHLQKSKERKSRKHNTHAVPISIEGRKMAL